MPEELSDVQRKELLKTVSPATRLSAARGYEELYEAIGAFIDDIMQRERAGEPEVQAADLAFVLGAVYSKMSLLNERSDPTCPNPECTFTNGKGKVFPTYLDTIEHNYSGTGVDIMGCPNPECKREYTVTYRLDKITRMDPDTMEEM